MNHRCFAPFRVVALASVATLLAAASAHAVLVTQSWDPVFGGTLGNLAFTGEATYHVADACVQSPFAPYSGPTFVGANAPCVGSDSIALLSAKVNLFDITGIGVWNPLTNPGTFKQTLNFAPATLFGIVLDTIGGQTEVVGSNVDYMGPSAFAPDFGKYFYLRLGPFDCGTDYDCTDSDPGDPGETTEAEALDSTTAARFNRVYLIAVDSPTTAASAGEVGAAATSEFQTIPEPGTLALALGAVVAGLSVRRRRA